MQYYFAPMEGLTDGIYRRLHQKYFPGIDRYYMPFISPTVHRCLTSKEARELPPASHWQVTTVPQVLTKVADDFLWIAKVCSDLGYEELNLNLGCPSGTVTAKGKGAGMLRDLSALDRFLEEIFAGTPLPISVKTRLGFENPEEFIAILDIYNRYPIKELTVHPRVRQVFYNGPVDMNMFDYACQNSKLPLCYNGNLCSTEDIESFSRQYPQVQAVMLGRGLIGDPGMLCPEGTTAAVLESFLNELFEEYCSAFGSARNAMFRMKENWRHLFCLFEENTKLQKQLRKAVDVAEYKTVTAQILHNLPMHPRLQPDW